MGEMAEQALEEAERQWLAEHPGCTVEDYERDIEQKYQEEEKRQRAEAIATRLQTIVEALQDGIYWVGKDGQRISIWSIDKRYARNLITWFDERRKGLHDSACIWFMALPELNGEQAGYAVEEEFNRLSEAEPTEWLNGQPLYQHLKLIASGKELVMSEKQKFTLRCSNPESGEVRETWVEASSKIEATQKFLRRKDTAEWFLEGNAIAIEVFDEIEADQDAQKRKEDHEEKELTEGDGLLEDDETGPNGETVERPGDHQQPSSSPPPGPPDSPHPPHHRPVG